MYIDSMGRLCKLFGGKNGNLYKKYELSYEEASRTLKNYFQSDKRIRGDENLRISLYLDAERLFPGGKEPCRQGNALPGRRLSHVLRRG